MNVTTNDFALFAFILAQDGKAAPKQSLLEALLSGPAILFIGLGIIWYLTMIQPERRRRAEEQAMLAALKKNDRVITAGGIHGTVVSIASETGVVTLRVDENSNTRIKINRTSIINVVDPNKEKKDSSDKDS